MLGVGGQDLCGHFTSNWGLSVMQAFIMYVVSVGLLVFESEAAPVAEEQCIGTDFRRTTLFVHDLEASLAFYRDAIGMEVMFDNKAATSQNDQGDRESASVPRFVFLRSNDNFVGILALYQADASAGPPNIDDLEPGRTGSIALLFNTDELDARFEKAKASPKVRVIRPPTKMDYGLNEDGSEILVFSSVLLDPDGHMIELNHLVQDP